MGDIEIAACVAMTGTKMNLSRTVCFLTIILTTVWALAQTTPSTESRRFQDAAEWARRFDDPARDSWQKPEEVLRALALNSSAIVADVGAGTGYFAARLARALPEGKVYAADVEPEMVRHLRERARGEGIANLQAVEATRDDPRLPEAVDLVLMVNVQGLMVSPGDYFARLRSSIRPGGRVAIISTRIDAPVGAREDMRVSPDKVRKDMAEQGYDLVAEHDFLPYQFFFVFSPKR
jgi:predicted methyltransferase